MTNGHRLGDFRAAEVSPHTGLQTGSQNQDEDRSAFFWGLPSIEAGPGDPLLRPPECLCWGSVWVSDISPYLDGNSPSPGTTPQNAHWRPPLTPTPPPWGGPGPKQAPADRTYFRAGLKCSGQNPSSVGETVSKNAISLFCKKKKA